MCELSGDGRRLFELVVLLVDGAVEPRPRVEEAVAPVEKGVVYKGGNDDVASDGERGGKHFHC